MERAPFLLITTDARRVDALAILKTLLPDTAEQLKGAGADNFSLWRAENLILVYFETPDMEKLRAAGAVIRSLASQLEETADLLASPGNMRLMYHFS